MTTTMETAVESLTEKEGQIATDLGEHAAKQCCDVVIRSMELIEKPAQSQIICVVAACGLIGCAMGSVLAQYPDLTRAKARDIVLAAIGEILDDVNMQEPS